MKPFDPRSTVFTNLALDKIMPIVSPNAWKIICLAIRKTSGWQDLSTDSGRKESDVISLSQFESLCGMSRKTAIAAIDECLNAGYLIRHKDGLSFRYSINMDYELTSGEITPPTGGESPLALVENLHTQTVSVNYNNTYMQDSLQANEQSPAKKNGDQMNKEDYLASVNKSLEIGMSSATIGYAQYPERLRPIVERMEKLWFFKPPQRTKKGGQFAFWIESCDEILEGCGEFGVELLDRLHADWYAYMTSHGGCAPYTVSSPKSLVSAVYGKAAQLRSGSKAPYWKIDKPQKQSMLDV